MTATPTMSLSSGLGLLPTELLVEIMKHVPDFPTLGNLLKAVPRGKDIVVRFQDEIVVGLFETGTSSQIGVITHVVMALRRHMKRCDGSTGLIQGLGVHNLESSFMEPATVFAIPDTPSLLVENQFADLYHITDVADGIEEIFHSFARVRILGPSAQSNRPLSTTEALRIRRALWRFQLCWELCYAEGSAMKEVRTTPSDSPNRFVFYQTHQASTLKDPPKRGWLYGHAGGFFSLRNYERGRLFNYVQGLCRWEIEEMEAIRFHIAAEVNALQYRRTQGEDVDLSAQPHLLRRMVSDLDHWQEAVHNSTDHILVADWRLRNYPSEVSRYWPENGKANWVNTTHRARLSARFEEQWGWCMWDEERLADRGLLCDDILKAEKIGLECLAAQYTPIDRWVAAKWKEDREQTRSEVLRKEELARMLVQQSEQTRQSGWIRSWVKNRDPVLFAQWIDALRILKRRPDDAAALAIARACCVDAEQMMENLEQKSEC